MLSKLKIALAIAIISGLLVALNFEAIRRALVEVMTPTYAQALPSGTSKPRFTGADAQRKQLRIGLQTIAKGIEQPTDIQFPPGVSGYAVVLQKTGDARWLRLKDGAHGQFFQVDVQTASEEGLLGLAFHPRFADNRRLFLNYVTQREGQDVTRIAEWQVPPVADFSEAKAKEVSVLLEVPQPYANHNAGQLAFGPDGYLYVGFGDGGYRDDPQNRSQNPSELLGKMLRLDVDKTAKGKPYAIPSDNPFLDKPSFRPEIWAYGLRNPWRYSFDPRDRLIIADVGQDTWEEIDIAQAGDNLGWKLKEGFACTGKQETCARDDLVDPLLVYGRREGNSITGGYVYTGKRVAALRDLYVYGDFGSGRLWAIALPEDRSARIDNPIALGQWPMMPSAFGRDHDGELYVANFASGEIFRLTGK